MFTSENIKFDTVIYCYLCIVILVPKCNHIAVVGGSLVVLGAQFVVTAFFLNSHFLWKWPQMGTLGYFEPFPKVKKNSMTSAIYYPAFIFSCPDHQSCTCILGSYKYSLWMMGVKLGTSFTLSINSDLLFDI